MTDKEKRLVAALRNSYDYSERRDKDAAKMIVKLSADRDAWKRRAEAAERDIETLRMEGCAGYDFCAKFGSCPRSANQGGYILYP